MPVKEGIKTNQNFCQKQETEPFDLESARNSIDMEILDAYNNGYEFCDEQHASGGTEGDRRTIQLTSNKGNIKVKYEMFDVPDALQLFHEAMKPLL